MGPAYQFRGSHVLGAPGVNPIEKTSIHQATIGNRQQTQDETHQTHYHEVEASSFVDVRTIQ